MIIGIDLGTTKSVVGFMKAGKPVIIPDAQGRTSIPSLVLVTPSEEIFVGHAARRHSDFFHGKSITISSVKRMMGKQGETGWGWWKTHPQEVSAFILAELKMQAEMYLGQKVSAAVIAIPSHFDESQRRATKEAARIAGLECYRLLNEANAAALAYGFDLNRDERILVFDFGGGTLDVAILEMGAGVFEVKSIAGDSKLGGDDFDEIIYNYVLEQCRQEHGTTLELTPAQEVFLREAARHAKVELSQAINTSIYYPSFVRVGNNHADLAVSIDRSTFEQLSQPLFDRAAAVLRNVVNAFRPGVKELDRVLLLGGSSRIPYLGPMIKKELGITPFRGVDPEMAVAQGAVLYAGVLKGEVKDILLLDVTPGSYGIETLGGVFTRIIDRNTTIPTRKSFISTTTQDNQQSVAIRVFQGERDMAVDNLYLESIILEGIPPAPRGVPQIEVTLDIDINMIVQASAKNLSTGKEQNARVQSPYGLNEAQIKLMIRKIETWLIFRRQAALRDSAIELTTTASDLLARFPHALTRELIEKLEQEYNQLLTLINQAEGSEKFSEALSHFKETIEEVQLAVGHYEENITRINTLISKIDSFVKDLLHHNASVGTILIQGKELLLDFQNRRVPFDDLQKLFLSVRAEYENARVLLLSRFLAQFLDSEEVSQWEREISKVISHPHLREHHLARLRNFTHVEQMISQLEDDEQDYRKLILQKTFQILENNPRAIAFYIILTTAFAGFHYGQLSHHFLLKSVTGAPSVSAFGLFAVGLRPDRPEPHRKAAAWLISRLPLHTYLVAVIDFSCLESSLEIKETLLTYLDAHPAGTFYEFFLKVGTKIREAICSDVFLIGKLLVEPQEESVLLALGHLGNFSFDDVLPLLSRLFNDSNPRIRAKALEHLLAMEYKGDQVRGIIAKVLYDPEFEIRMAAYKYLPKLNDESLLPIVQELIREEKNDRVKQQAIIALGELAFPETIPPLLLLSLETDEKLSSSALTVLEKKSIIDKEYRKLYKLIKKVVKKRSLNFIDKYRLNRMQKRSSYLGEAIQRLHQFTVQRKHPNE